MSKHLHEIRDPIHVFVRLDSDERAVLDSWPFQRLRHIHQLAMTYMLYPAATHKRFEHSLGVMELAGRVFDVVTNPAHVSDEVRKILPEVGQPHQLQYWRRALRMAALCHDMGHLPFSHAAEKELLPEGWDHERLTREIILSPEMAGIWMAMTPPLRPMDVVKLSVGPRKARDITFTSWESILAEIIVGDAFGADRMDYLLRDSYHAGVAYGRFDHFRLIDTLRIIPLRSNIEPGTVAEPTLGVEEGGVHSAEALLLARYYMYSQVYFHPIRRIYDIHLKDYLGAELPAGKFQTDLESHLQMTDNEVNSRILAAARDSSRAGHDAARRIANHDHFKVLYQRHPEDVKVNPEAGQAVFEGAKVEFGEENVRYDKYTQKREASVFPVLLRDGRIASAEKLSEVLQHLPVVAVDYVFIRADLLKDANPWLTVNRDQLIQARKET
ncbi:MAG: HD domain-containing protein [Isosphaeraceae bacterium]